MAGLAITRKVGESFYIGEHIVITIVEIERGQTKIKVVAPKELPIYREEILKRIKAENLKAEEDKNAGLR